MKEANPKLIGVFVVGGMALLVVALVLFSSQDLFSPKRHFVAYFQQSVSGLNIGAAVRFRGIPVGKVIHIDGIYNPKTGNMIPRLILEIHPETLRNVVLNDADDTQFFLLIKNGMRAKLKSASLLTGQLYVALDFYPNTPVRRLGSDSEEYPEMPTIDSGLDQALAKLSELPIEEVLVRLGSTLAAVEELLKNPHVNEALAALPPLLRDADTGVVDLTQFVNHDLALMAQDASQTLASVRNSFEILSTKLTDESLVQINSTLIELENTLQLAQKRLSRDDPLTYELLSALREVGSAARSMRAFADYLEEHPESLIKGKASK
ncbi:MAG: MlaD family protein [Acidiferrobacterales bacterium]